MNTKLTVNYGVRYTVIVPYSALWRNMIVFDPTLYNPADAVSVIPTGPQAGQIIVGNGDRYNGMVIPGDGFPDSAKGRFPESTSGQLQLLVPGRQVSRLLLTYPMGPNPATARCRVPAQREDRHPGWWWRVLYPARRQRLYLLGRKPAVPANCERHLR